MPHRQDLEKSLQSFIINNFKFEPEEILGNFATLANQIQNLSKKAGRDVLLDRLFTSFFLLLQKKEVTPEFALKIIDEVAQIRFHSKNILSKMPVDSINALLARIDVANLNPTQTRDLLKNLDFIGVKFPDFRQGNLALTKVVEAAKRASYKGCVWAKNIAHTLAHCKNIGLLNPPIDEFLREDLGRILERLANYLEKNRGNLGFEASDSGAALDVFLYCRHVLEIEYPKNYVALAAESFQRGEPKISPAQRKIFNKIIDFLQKGDAESGSWSHVAAKENKGNKFIYAGIIEVELEGIWLEEAGDVIRTGDIVFRNLATGEIIMVVEVDGDPHFLSDVIKTPRTEARNQLMAAVLDSAKITVINVDEFGSFMGAAAAQDEANFLCRIRKLLDSELAKQISEEAPRIPASKESETKSLPSSLMDKGVVVGDSKASSYKSSKGKFARNKKQIEEDLLIDFWSFLHKGDFNNMMEILSDPRFEAIKKHKVIDPETRRNPFDYVLALCKTTQAAEKYSETLRMLWIYGFENKEKALVVEGVNYPPELNAALGKEAQQEAPAVKQKAISRDL